MFAALDSHVMGLRQLAFLRTIDGLYNLTEETDESRRITQYLAESRFHVVAAKMKYFRLRGSGESEDTIMFLNIHLHAVTSRK